jgi:glycine cleavage system H protein
VEAESSEFIVYRRARFTAHFPLRRLYTPSHHWLEQQEPGVWRVGLTKFASRMLGEMVDFGFEVQPNAPVAPGQALGWLEGFKALSDLLCVGQGTFAGGNPLLEKDPTIINQDPHGVGWLYAFQGEPDSTAVDTRSYAVILDQIIDELSGNEAGE